MLVSGLSSSNILLLNKTYQEQEIEKKNTVKETESTESTQSKSSSLEKTIIEMAKKDASKGVYMDHEFVVLERKCVSEVSPNRSLAIAQVSNLMKNENKKGYDLIDGIKRWISELLDLPYKAEIKAGAGHDTAQIYSHSHKRLNISL